MKILCVHCSLVVPLEAMGHQCLAVHAPAGIQKLGLLAGDFVPDLIIQQETLGPRTFFSDLDAFACRKVFWSIDTHLNSFWHRYYARLFDLVLTTQKHWVSWLEEQGIAHVDWLPWHGSARPVAAWETRRPGMTFVGRLTAERPVRGWFVELLRQLGEVRVHEGLGHGAMLAEYDRSMLVPNEAIFGEVNFRLFEAASCACAVLTPATPGTEDLFTSGEDVLLYRDGAELTELIRQLSTDPIRARLLGLKAWERVQHEHLPKHRAARLLERVTASVPAAVTGGEARKALWLTIHVLWQCGRIRMSQQQLEERLLTLPLDENVLAALIAMVCRRGEDACLRLLAPILENGQYAHCTEVNLAGAMAALRYADLRLARLFCLRQKRFVHAGFDVPGNEAVAFCLTWSRELQRCGMATRPGFHFDPKVNLPGSALECLVLAGQYKPEDPEIYSAMQQYLRQETGWENLRLKALSFLSLRDRDNWRLGLELGLTDCRAFRIRQGLEEILLAWHAAEACGQGVRCLDVLQRMDAAGHIAALVRNALKSTKKL